MSATDELRAELTKRGVAWEAPSSYDGSNRYDTVAGGYWLHEFDGKITIHGLTPAQAIAATVGSGRAEDVIRQLIARLGDAADFHFARKYVDCIVEEYATKLATLSAWTCHYSPDDVGFTWWDENDVEHCEEYSASYECSSASCDKCGYTMMVGDDGWFDGWDEITEWTEEDGSEHKGYVLKPRFNFCPNCGRKVVDE